MKDPHIQCMFYMRRFFFGLVYVQRQYLRIQRRYRGSDSSFKPILTLYLMQAAKAFFIQINTYILFNASSEGSGESVCAAESPELSLLDDAISIQISCVNPYTCISYLTIFLMHLWSLTEVSLLKVLLLKCNICRGYMYFVEPNQ